MEFTSNITVEPIGSYGGDWLVIDAARVSTKGTAGAGPRNIEEPRDVGLIRSLIKQRHGAPFQHGGLTFFVEAPIFVFREWRTHRIAMAQSTDDFAYSEQSARYKELKPKFWIPERFRPMLKQENHKAMKPVYDPVPDDGQYNGLMTSLKASYIVSWNTYEELLKNGVAPEVARACLPVATYSSMYVSANPRSLMHFLSLRVHDSQAAFVSYPQWEIEQAAKQAEMLLKIGWPVTYQAFTENGRFAG